jgi:glycosyltransferase involved in cell wall biosynthesis
MLTTVHDLNWIPHEEGTSPHVLELLKINIKRLERIKPHIVAVSESAKREITEYTPLPPEKIHVVYQSYDEKNLYPDKSDRTVLDTMGIGDEYMFFVGTFERKKNIVRIVEAFNAIAQKHKHLQLVLAGQPTWDDSSSIYNAVRNSPFSERIILPGYIDTAVKRKLYSNAVCLVFPSICEGFGIPVLEAMVCGCPVITADNTSLPEVGGDAAIYVNALDSNALSHEMDRMISSRSLRKDLTERGLLQAKKFSWDKTARQIEDIYKLMSEE